MDARHGDDGSGDEALRGLCFAPLVGDEECTDAILANLLWVGDWMHDLIDASMAPYVEAFGHDANAMRQRR